MKLDKFGDLLPTDKKNIFLTVRYILAVDMYNLKLGFIN